MQTRQLYGKSPFVTPGLNALMSWGFAVPPGIPSARASITFLFRSPAIYAVSIPPPAVKPWAGPTNTSALPQEIVDPGYPPAAPYGTTTVSPSGTDETNAPRPQNGSVQPRPPQPVDTNRVNARDELARAESEVAAAQKDCASACRALASMERAAKSLCDLGGADECSQARARVEAARDRVRSSCGSCPGGR